MKIENVPIAKINIGKRYRVDDGDIETLAGNIRDIGLLQAVGVDSYYNLIFGARRLEACKDILKWETIPCVVLQLDSILTGEYAENEFRKAFTPSEREAIGRAIEAELGNRRGVNQHTRNCGEPRGESVDIAAQRAGFKSAETYERAKTVVERGAPEVIKAMDSGEVSIAAAAAIASQPKVEQVRIVSMPTDERKTVVRDIRKAKAEREANERRARDLRLYRGLYNAVHFLADFSENATETWAGLSRVSAYKFADELPPAIECLLRIKKGHPNEGRKPRLAT